jgi:hypothetical protein
MCYEKHKSPKYTRQVWAQPCYSSHTDEWNDLLILKSHTEAQWRTISPDDDDDDNYETTTMIDTFEPNAVV